MTEITSYFKCKSLPFMFKFTGLLLVSFLLFSSSVFAQSTNPVSIIWSGGVGCQVYETGEPPRDEKEPLF
ncbi:hypothetical protein [Flavobacterium sp. UBA6135]|uniref:hypothetical protein n=1 Tax=Flavobacterium sp. UBA6135 TaxID=1946553 RepID=UPI0025C6F29B|nr:hypothetical protein [Flavobacterium sp. UBA6135]